MATAEGIQPLTLSFNLRCPTPLPERPALIQWPWPIAGPSTASEEPSDFLRRRYLETLYVGEPVFPLSGLVADLGRIDLTALAPLLARHALDLPAIEARYRTRLLPVLKVAVSGGDARDALSEAGLKADEAQALLAGVELRTKSRAAVEGSKIVTAKALAEEYEQTEVLIQLLLLLFRRRAERQTDPDSTRSARRALETQLELLADRIGVWHAVAELGIGLDEPASTAYRPGTAAKEEESERGIQGKLKRYWKECLLPHFLSTEAQYLNSWHHKVFGVPMPAELMPVKKPRKPKITRRLSVESHDTHARPPAASMSRSDSSNSRKRARDSTGTGGQTLGGHSRRGSLDRRDSLGSLGGSLASLAGLERESRRDFRRSTSVMSTHSQDGQQRCIVRAPSGRDIFKGREMVLKRTSSQKTIQRTNSLSTTGLLGRTIESQSQSQSLSASTSQSQGRAGGREYRRSQSQREVREKDSETLVYATPSKPKGKLFAFAHPTPIREEPSSGSRYEVTSFVAETPMATRVAETPLSARLHAAAATKVQGTPTPRRVALSSVAETPVAAVAETPMDRRGRWVQETPSRSRRYVQETPSRSTGRRSYYDPGHSDDDLAGLMVPTDDEESPLKRH